MIERVTKRTRELSWSDVFSSTWMLAVILALTVVFYAPSVNQWFFGDDFHFLRRSQTTDWHTWFIQTWDFRDPRPVPEFPPYRPLYLLTIRAEYSLFGLHSFGYHAINLLAHLLAVGLLWLITIRLTRRRQAAHLAALIFALHPGYPSTVAWISNGNAVLATVCYLLAFLLFMKFADGGRRSGQWYAAFVISFTAALLFHPMTTPLVAALLAWYFLVQHHLRDALRWRSWTPFLPVAAIVLPFLDIQRWVRAQDFNETVSLQINWKHMLQVYRDYLEFALYPWRDGAGPPIGGLLASISFGAMAIISVLLLTRWRWPAVPVFAVFWFYTSLLPNSAFLFGAQPRLFYLPAASLAVVIAVTVTLATDALSVRLPAIRPPHALHAIAAITLVIVAASLLRARHPSTLSNSSFIIREASANEQFLSQLRRDYPELPRGGTLYVVNPPAFLTIIGTDYNLESLVQLYYGDVHVLAVPLRQPPYWNEQQVRPALGGDDRIITFHSDASP